MADSPISRSLPVASLALLVVLAFPGCTGPNQQRAQPPAPSAEEVERATRAYRRGMEVRAAGAPETAATYFRRAADLGHAAAAYELGLAYLTGDGVPENLELSARWINRAADLGDPGAQFLVGSSFYGGIGVEQDVERGLSFLERAAEQGYPKAQFLLGQAYADGVGVDADAEWAARWYGKAARGGHPQAQYALGVMLATGFGVPANPRRAYKWFSLATAGNYPGAAELRDKMAERISPESRARADAEAAAFTARRSAGFADAPSVMYVQIRLRALGYAAGPVDGVFGPRTRAAIEAFQADERLTVDGELSRNLVEDLFARATPRGA